VILNDLDHVVVHVHDWGAAHAFYIDALGMERVENPEALGNPLDACAYRVGAQQINVHGPWPGNDGQCCPPPLNEAGRADLAFATVDRPDEVIARLGEHGIAVASGPIRRFGARGWGTSIYCHDPSGNGIEIICYAGGVPSRADAGTTARAPSKRL
jgi:catechol 2,3-dioxygenase-like lactoylglutathione lyase family enzyme